MRTPLLAIAASLMLCGVAQAETIQLRSNYTTMLAGSPPFDVDHPTTTISPSGFNQAALSSA